MRAIAAWIDEPSILTSSDWYTLGVPFDMETPGGLRTAYPLTRMDTSKSSAAASSTSCRRFGK